MDRGFERTSVSTRDVETGVAALEQIYPKLKIPMPSGAAFGLDLTSVTTGPLSAHQCRLTGASFQNSSDLSDVLLVGHRLSGEVGIATGESQIVTATPFLFPQDTITAQWQDVDFAAIGLDPTALQDYARLLAGSERFRLKFLGNNPLDPATTRMWVGVANHLYQDILPNDEAMNVALIRSEAFRSVCRALLHCFPNTFLDQPPPPDGARTVPAVIRRAVEFIDTHLQDDIGLVEIAAAARMSPRGLVAAFRHHRDMTPSEYLRQARMDAAHQELLSQRPPCPQSLQATALRWGFTDQENFSAEYRKAFGRPPSDGTFDD